MIRNYIPYLDFHTVRIIEHEEKRDLEEILVLGLLFASLMYNSHNHIEVIVLNQEED